MIHLIRIFNTLGGKMNDESHVKVIQSYNIEVITYFVTSIIHYRSM